MLDIYDKNTKLELQDGYIDRLTACKFLVASVLKNPNITGNISTNTFKGYNNE